MCVCVCGGVWKAYDEPMRQSISIYKYCEINYVSNTALNTAKWGGTVMLGQNLAGSEYQTRGSQFGTTAVAAIHYLC